MCRTLEKQCPEHRKVSLFHHPVAKVVEEIPPDVVSDAHLFFEDNAVVLINRINIS
jgi:hypothetical protein